MIEITFPESDITKVGALLKQQAEKYLIESQIDPKLVPEVVLHAAAMVVACQEMLSLAWEVNQLKTQLEICNQKLSSLEGPSLN
jgi:hypothetical protein